MIRLLKVELTRLRWRRAIVVLLLGCVAVPLVLMVGYAWSTRPFSDADIAEAKQMAARDAAQPFVNDQLAECEEDPDMFLGPGGDATDCEQAVVPTYENYLYRETVDLESIRTDVGAAAITILTGLLMLIGTTFAGHDWNTGSMSNQLLFEPRRLRVWAAKGLAILITGALVGTAVLALFWAGAAVLASSRDVPVPVPAGTWSAILETQARGVLAIAIGGLLGYALTMLFRSTVATLSLMFGVSIAGSLIIVAILGNGATRWLLPTNFLAFVLGGFDYFDESACTAYSEGAEVNGLSTGLGTGDCMQRVSTLDGGVFLAVIVVVSVLLSVRAMQRRDVP